MHDLFAASRTVEGALDGFDLTLEAAHACQQLAFFADSVCHPAQYSLAPYSIQVNAAGRAGRLRNKPTLVA
jgi:hypothetical protein